MDYPFDKPQQVCCLFCVQIGSYVKMKNHFFLDYSKMPSKLDFLIPRTRFDFLGQICLFVDTLLFNYSFRWRLRAQRRENRHVCRNFRGPETHLNRSRRKTVHRIFIIEVCTAFRLSLATFRALMWCSSYCFWHISTAPLGTFHQLTDR